MKSFIPNPSKRFLKTAASLSLVFFFVLSSHPAFAVCCGGTTQEGTLQTTNSKLDNVKTAISDMETDLLEALSKIQTSVANNSVFQSPQFSALNKTVESAGQAQINNAYRLSELQAQMATAQRHVQSLTRQHCYTVKARQMPMIMKQFASVVETDIGYTVEGMYRGAKTDGAGPQRAADMMQQSCKKIQDLNPADNPPSECMNASKIPPDISRTSSILSGRYTLELPPMNKKDGVLIPAPDSNIVEQTYFMAALNYCMTFAGPKPPTTYGKQFKTAQGITSWANSSSGQALQSPFNDVCNKRLARLTRPNATDSEQAVFRSASHDACAAAAKAGLSLPSDQFLCTSGKERLSLDQIEYIASHTCLGSQYAIDLISEGATESEAMMAGLACQQAVAAWDQTQAIDRNTFVAAAQGQLAKRGQSSGGVTQLQ